MHGVHTALVTPFNASGDVDLDAFARLAQRQLDAGIHGLVPCGTTGETPTLTASEWELCTRAAVELAAGKVPVTTGVGTNATASTVATCERALELGADAGLLVFPYYNKPNPEGHRAHVRAALATGLPLVLYHVPGRTGQRLAPELIAELASYDGVIGVKEASGDLQLGTNVITRTSTPILSGDDFSFLGLLAQGGAGVISVVSNVDPAGTVEVYERFAAGDTAGARAAFLRIWELMHFLFSDTNPTPTKAALARLGLCEAHVRGPLAPYAGNDTDGVLSRIGML